MSLFELILIVFVVIVVITISSILILRLNKIKYSIDSEYIIISKNGINSKTRQLFYGEITEINFETSTGFAVKTIICLTNGEKVEIPTMWRKEHDDFAEFAIKHNIKSSSFDDKGGTETIIN